MRMLELLDPLAKPVFMVLAGQVFDGVEGPALSESGFELLKDLYDLPKVGPFLGMR